MTRKKISLVLYLYLNKVKWSFYCLRLISLHFSFSVGVFVYIGTAETWNDFYPFDEIAARRHAALKLVVERLWNQDEVITSTSHFPLSVFWSYMLFVSQQL